MALSLNQNQNQLAPRGTVTKPIVLQTGTVGLSQQAVNTFHANQNHLQIPPQFSLPPQFSVTVTTPTTLTGTSQTLYLFNQDYMNNVTTLASPAGSGTVSYAWSDNFSGAVLSQMLSEGYGTLLKGFHVNCVTTSSQAANVAALTSANFKAITQDGLGNTIPQATIIISATDQRSDQNLGLGIASLPFVVNRYTQLAWTATGGVTYSFVFMVDAPNRRFI